MKNTLFLRMRSQKTALIPSKGNAKSMVKTALSAENTVGIALTLDYALTPYPLPATHFTSQARIIEWTLKLPERNAGATRIPHRLPSSSVTYVVPPINGTHALPTVALTLARRFVPLIKAVLSVESADRRNRMSFVCVNEVSCKQVRRPCRR